MNDIFNFTCSLLHYILSFLVPGCDDVALVGNGFCNDEANNEDCNYDGGDCCVVNANTNYCSDCACHLIETCAAGYHPLVGNGFCDDETNIAECNYDDGDCCGYSINSDHCNECTCFHQETCLAGVTHAFVGNGVCNDETNIAECDYDGADCCSNLELVANSICNDEINIAECNFDGGDCCQHPSMVGDAVCNDETNHLGCNYDGGDCCVNVNTNSCSECNCLGGGVITSPGFPGNYDNYLDLTWLIQVQMGQTIEINFLSFDVQPNSICL